MAKASRKVWNISQADYKFALERGLSVAPAGTYTTYGSKARSMVSKETGEIFSRARVENVYYGMTSAQRAYETKRLSKLSGVKVTSRGYRKGWLVYRVKNVEDMNTLASKLPRNSQFWATAAGQSSDAARLKSPRIPQQLTLSLLANTPSNIVNDDIIQNHVNTMAWNFVSMEYIDVFVKLP